MSTLLTIAGSVGDFLATVPQQVIAHHNVTLANISSFGPLTRAVPVAALIREGRLALPAHEHR